MVGEGRGGEGRGGEGRGGRGRGEGRGGMTSQRRERQFTCLLSQSVAGGQGWSLSLPLGS